MGIEGQKNKVDLHHGIYITDSKTGNSSNRHNPFFMLKTKETTYNYGDSYAFNLIYSGNHYEMVEVSSFNKIRIQTGINPYCFKYELKEIDPVNFYALTLTKYFF
jgi:alpha-galactosidase